MTIHDVPVEPGVAPDDARARLLAGLPVTQRTVPLAGIPTAVLTGGAGPTLVLLHGPGANATHWMRLLPGLVTAFRVIAPELPGHGASGVGTEPLDRARILSWLDALIEHTGPDRPVLVGHALGGAIAARFAVDRAERLRGMVLVDTLGLVPLAPAAEFGHALTDFLAGPSDGTHDELWRYCAFDLGRLRERVGERWELFRAYNVRCARDQRQQTALGAMMAEFGGPPIPAHELRRITVPTTLVWGRSNLATPLAAAQDAAARHDWALHVIGGCADDPPMEAPEELLRILRTVAAVPTGSRSRS